MLYHLAAWAVLVFFARAIGGEILRAARCQSLPSADRFFLAVWLGVVALALSLLAASLFAPLSPSVTLGVATALALLARLTAVRTARRSRDALASVSSHPSVREPTGRHPARGAVILGTVCVALATAALASDPVTLYDSLVYHVGIAKWLREHGTVFGTALVHNRLGHVSAWFTLSAPFDAGPGAGRAWNVGMGLVLVLVSIHGALGASRIVARQATACDWLIALGSLAFVWAAVVYAAATPSPDVAANVLIVLVAWAMCLTAGASTPDEARSALVSPRLIPLLLAAGAAAVKLFALPAVVVAALFYVRPDVATPALGTRERLALRRGARVPARLAVCLGVMAVLFAPLVAANLVASGCPLYPAPYGCLDVAWSVGAAEARDYSEYIRDVARWESRNIPRGDPAFRWVTAWVGAHPVVAVSVLAGPVLALVIMRDARTEHIRPALLLAVLGIGFAAWHAPAPRFLFGYLVLVPASVIAHAAGRTAAIVARDAAAASAALGRGRGPSAGLGFVTFAGAAAVAIALASQKVNVWSAMRSDRPMIRLTEESLILPERPAPPDRLSRHRINDVELYTPVPSVVFDTLGYRSVIDGELGFEKCSSAPLPCTPHLPPPTIRLRDARRGIGGGFELGARRR